MPTPEALDYAGASYDFSSNIYEAIEALDLADFIAYANAAGVDFFAVGDPLELDEDFEDPFAGQSYAAGSTAAPTSFSSDQTAALAMRGGARTPAWKTGVRGGKLNYARAWHNFKVRAEYGAMNGRAVGGRDRVYDAKHGKWDVELKTSNFSKGPPSPGSIERMRLQAQKDVKYGPKNLKQANPYWHFTHDPRQSPEMRGILRILDKGGIKWGTSKPT